MLWIPLFTRCLFNELSRYITKHYNAQSNRSKETVMIGPNLWWYVISLITTDPFKVCLYMQGFHHKLIYHSKDPWLLKGLLDDRGSTVSLLVPGLFNLAWLSLYLTLGRMHMKIRKLWTCCCYFLKSKLILGIIGLPQETQMDKTTNWTHRGSENNTLSLSYFLQLCRNFSTKFK